MSRPQLNMDHSHDLGTVPDRRRFLAVSAGLLSSPMLLGSATASDSAQQTGSTHAARPAGFQPTADTRTVTLNNGLKMPVLGFGTFQLNGEECQRSVSEAIEAGYRLIDTASAYRNEDAVGNAIKASGVPREQLFVTTKLWVSDAGYEKAKAAFDRSLGRLGLDYLDLYLIHQPFNDIYGAWRAMEELYKAGRVKAIGVSNFHPDRVMDLIVHNEVKPAVNQIETHVFHQRGESLEFLKEQNVQMEAWSPFGQGKKDFFNNELLRTIGEKHGKTVAQVALRWHLQRGVIAIPKSSKKARIVENFDIFGFELSGEEMAQIATLETGASVFFDHRDPKVVRMLSGRGPSRDR
ncbi:MAG: aldo/keto reductase [Phycisphaerales bacterium]